MQNSDRLMFVIIMSCTGDLLLGTAMVRVAQHHSVFSNCFSFSLFFEDYKIPELNGSNRNVRFQIK